MALAAGENSRLTFLACNGKSIEQDLLRPRRVHREGRAQQQQAQRTVLLVAVQLCPDGTELVFNSFGPLGFTFFLLQGVKQCHQLFQLNTFTQVVKFLLGVDVDPGEDYDARKHRRRWSSLQTKDFGEVHTLLAYLIMSCNMESNRKAGERTG